MSGAATEQFVPRDRLSPSDCALAATISQEMNWDLQRCKLMQGLGWMLALQRSGQLPGTVGHCQGAAAPTGSHSSWSMQEREDTLI